MYFQVFILQVYLHMHTQCIISNELLSVKVFSLEEVCPWRWLGHPFSKYGPSPAQLVYLLYCFYVFVLSVACLCTTLVWLCNKYVTNMCHLSNFKGLQLNGFSTGNACKLHNSPAVAPAEVVFV